MTLLKSLILVILCAVCTSEVTVAQEFDPARIKTLGEAMQGHQHVTYQRLGQERAKILYYNVQPQGNTQVQAAADPQANVRPEELTPIAETKEMIVAIRKDLKASDAALAKIKAGHSSEPDVVKQIALIEKHHMNAHDACGLADDAFQKGSDQAVIGKCCSDMWHELEAAQVDTQKLLKMLKIEKLEPPKKLEAAKPVLK